MTSYPDRLLAASFFLFLIALGGGPWEIAAVASFCLIIVSCYSNSGMSKVLFGGTVVHFLGEISFSIYIWHMFIINIVTHMILASPIRSHLGSMLACGISPLLVIAIGWMSWRAIELPSQALGRAAIGRSNFLSGHLKQAA